MAKTNKAFQERLTSYRKERNLSLREMASILDVTPTAIYRWEKTDDTGVSSSSVKKICRLFGISREKLFGEQQEVNDGFVKFTFLSGEPFYVKPEMINGFGKNEHGEGSHIFFSNTYCVVKESVSDIRGALNV